jgi:hypothetical protein
MRGITGRLNEWLEGISAAEVKLIVQEILKDLNSAPAPTSRPILEDSRIGVASGGRSIVTKKTMADGCDPAETIRLLVLLRKLGFTDTHFSIVHHFLTERIENHLRYCRKTIQFRPASN